jgi:hypothetical protein
MGTVVRRRLVVFVSAFLLGVWSALLAQDHFQIGWRRRSRGLRGESSESSSSPPWWHGGSSETNAPLAS